MNIMQEIKTAEINIIGTTLTRVMPHQFWVDTVAFVTDLCNNDKLTPAQKHDKVSKDLHAIFITDLEPILDVFGETFVDVAIKLACMYVTSLNPIAGTVAIAVTTPITNSIEADLKR